jgi:hypothetical protein
MGESSTATVDRRMHGGRGLALLSASDTRDLPERGVTEEEYRVSGTARAYAPVEELGADGRWTVGPGPSAPFATRLVVRRPTDPARANGTVLVEWLNVSAGADSAPDWTYLADELIRGGYAWVGVSVQAVGVMGGGGLVGVPDGATAGLVETDSERYGDLHHPGDAFAFDLFTQVGRLLREPGSLDPLGGQGVERLLAVGESQSAFFLTSYANAHQPIQGVYDGLLIHSRGVGSAQLDGAVRVDPARAEPVRVRPDLAVPVLTLETETDVGPMLGYALARQPDTERLRLWEVAGTAHADDYQVGGMSHLFGFEQPPTAGPQHLVVKAALAHLDRWVATGQAPPPAPRLTVVVDDDGEPRLVRDGLGNALGGIRTPLVDVPVAVLSGDNQATERFQQLFGQTTPLDPTVLAGLYPSRAAYLAAYRQSADDAVAAGWVLSADRDALLALAQPELVPDGDDPGA